jgi:CBS domain containing-hemolysin-like protein
MEILPTLVVIVICLALEAFFSGSEIGIVSADPAKLRHDAAGGSRGAQLALEMLEKPEWLLSTTLVGTNIAIVTNTTVATALIVDLFGEQYTWLAVVLVAPFIWIFGEIVAKSVFQHHANTLTPRVIGFIRFASYLFYPILAAFALLTRALARLAGDDGKSNPFTIREEIVTMIEMAPVDGDIDLDEQTMIRRVFEFGETTAADVLVPLADVIGVERGATTDQAIRMAVDNAPHRRLPVYAGHPERIVGVLNTLDLLQANPDDPIESFVSPVPFCSPERSIEDLLVMLRSTGRPMVVVGTADAAQGIVTIEDILEEVVGAIEDEYDAADSRTRWIRELAKRDYLVNARVRLGMLKERLGIALPPGEYETLAGYLINQEGEIPETGDVFRHGRYWISVERATDRAVVEVRIRW